MPLALRVDLGRPVERDRVVAEAAVDADLDAILEAGDHGRLQRRVGRRPLLVAHRGVEPAHDLRAGEAHVAQVGAVERELERAGLECSEAIGHLATVSCPRAS